MQICGPSAEWIARLTRSGCPVDRAQLQSYKKAPRQPLRLCAVTGQFEPYAFDLSPEGTGYAIGVRIEALQKSGIVILNWQLTCPWDDSHITWGMYPEKLLRPRDSWLVENSNYQKFWDVLEERQRVTLARPIEGWVFGQSAAAMPPEIKHGDNMEAIFSITENSGVVVTLKMRIQIDRSTRATAKAAASRSRRRRRLFGDGKTADEVGTISV